MPTIKTYVMNILKKSVGEGKEIEGGESQVGTGKEAAEVSTFSSPSLTPHPPTD